MQYRLIEDVLCSLSSARAFARNNIIDTKPSTIMITPNQSEIDAANLVLPARQE